MSKVTVIAEITAKPGQFDALYERMLQHGKASRSEPGCLRFDISVPRKSQNTLALYELYEDQAGFDFHSNTDRFKAHREATADMVAERRIVVCDLKDSGDA